MIIDPLQEIRLRIVRGNWPSALISPPKRGRIFASGVECNLAFVIA
jgi:hypothetical protein